MTPTSSALAVDAPCITDRERHAIERANRTGRHPIVFIREFWPPPSSWDRWARLFEDGGYAALTVAWPNDPETIGEPNANPQMFARKSVGIVATRLGEIISHLTIKPAVIGHSLGGVLAQMLAGRGLSRATVAIDPAPLHNGRSHRFQALRAAVPTLHALVNRKNVVPLTYDRFRIAFANAVTEQEANELFNTNGWTEATVATDSANRGPMLIIAAGLDPAVPRAVASASFKRQKRNGGITEMIEIQSRGHSLMIDHAWRQVADLALRFIRRFA